MLSWATVYHQLHEISSLISRYRYARGWNIKSEAHWPKCRRMKFRNTSGTILVLKTERPTELNWKTKATTFKMPNVELQWSSRSKRSGVSKEPWPGGEVSWGLWILCVLAEHRILSVWSSCSGVPVSYYLFIFNSTSLPPPFQSTVWEEARQGGKEVERGHTYL